MVEKDYEDDPTVSKEVTISTYLNIINDGSDGGSQ